MPDNSSCLQPHNDAPEAVHREQPNSGGVAPPDAGQRGCTDRAAAPLAGENHPLAATRSSRPYQFIVNTSREFMSLIDQDYVYEVVNDAYCRAHDKERQEIVGRSVADLWGEEVFAVAIKPHLERCFAGEEVHYQSQFEFPASGLRYFDVAYYPYYGVGGVVTHAVVISHDVTARELAQQELRRLNRALRMLSECNRAVARAAGEEALLNDICRIAVDVGGYMLAWVGYAEQDEARQVRPVAWAGRDDGYLDSAAICWSDTERGRGPTGRAVRSGQPVVARDIRDDPLFGPWREEAIRRGYAASLALPIALEGRVWGALNLYTAERQAFDTQEGALLTEVADSLAFGLQSLHLRAVQVQSEQALRRYAGRLEVLREIDRAILAAQSPEEIAREAVHRIQQLVPCLGAGVALLDAEVPDLIVIAADFNGVPQLPAGTRLSLDAFPNARRNLDALSREKMSVLEDSSAVDTLIPELGRLISAQSASFCIVPLRSREEFVGILGLVTASRGDLDDEDLEITRSVANSLTIAIQNARLHEAERQRSEELARSNRLMAALSRLATQLQAKLDPNEVISTLGAELRRLGLHCALALLTDDAQAVELRYVSVGAQALKAIGKATGVEILGAYISRERWLHPEVLLEGESHFGKSWGTILSNYFPGISQQTTEYILGMAGLSLDSPVLFLPLSTVDRRLGLLVVSGPGLKEADLPAFSVLAGQLAFALENAWLFKQVRASHEQLKAISQRVLDIQEAERRHIALELHDQIGQSLTVLHLNLQTLSRQTLEPSLAQRLGTSIALVEQTLQQVRDLSLDLRPSMLDDLGLVAALRWYLDRQAQHAGLVADFNVDVQESRFASHIETACFRVAQEALTNVNRHAQASRIRVALQQVEHEVQLLIEDDGVGFDVQAALARAVQAQSLGLLGMRERVDLLGGRFEIESAPGSGTSIRVSIPLGVVV